MDNHATTPVDPRVLEAMLPCFGTDFGNAASTSHAYGWNAEKMAAESRNHIAKLIGAASKELIFTSGATESNNLALKGVSDVYREAGDHIITQVTEHKCVLETCHYLEKKGMRVTYLPVDSTGLISIEGLKKVITDKTILISIMFANNEIGTIQPVREIGEIAKEKGILFHVDAAQAVGKIPIDVEMLGIDLLSFSAHKMYGPKGVGGLYVRQKNPRVRLAPLFSGGGQEFGLRSGTLNVPGIVGMAKACEIAYLECAQEMRRITELRDRLHRGICAKVPDVLLNGHPTERLANNLNLSFQGVDGESMIMSLNPFVAVSSSSACMSGTSGTSYVLKALGLDTTRIQASIRFGLGRFNTAEQVDAVIDKVAEVVSKLRELSPVYRKK